MRHCIFSDVHANLEALEAFLAAAAKDSPDRYVFLGDVVGYGADPRACIAAVRKLGPEVLIAGNHEWGVLGLLDMGYFNEYAAAAIEWTRPLLDGEDTRYLETFVLSREDGACTFVHGSLEQPLRFRYVLDADDAGRSMRLARTPLIFVGHSHAAGVYYSGGGGAAKAAGMKARIEEGRAYLVNAGSVGQPRDGDPRLSYAIYDDGKRALEIKRADYDIASARKKILKAGLPEWLGSRLAEGR
jgi:predicted phosphodiesterase